MLPIMPLPRSSSKGDFWRIRCVDSTSSTNDDVRAAAEVGEPEGFVVQAMRQTAGRGRHGRVWESPEGNLYCSVLLRPAEPLRDYGHYSFVAALALYDAVRDCVPPSVAVTLKWPNDVLVEGKKIAGILLESGEGFLIVGIGLNVAHYPEDALYPATSLRAKGVETNVVEILTNFLTCLIKWRDAFCGYGFPHIRTAWLERAQQGALTVKLPGETVRGTMIGLGESGSLRLQLADGSERAIETGDVFFDAESPDAARD